MKRLVILCLVAVSTALLSFTAFAPVVQDSVSGTIYDQSDNSTIGEILVQEIENNAVISSVRADANGNFSISVRNSKPVLRFSDPDYGMYEETELTFDLSQDCTHVSVYMTQR